MSERKLVEYYSRIESKSVEWLWFPYIPYGKVTIIQGDPGEGKTSLALYLTSILSNGGEIPLTKTHSPAQIVIYQNAEDGGMIDLSNKARMKGTLTGAGVGGAMGAYTAYQGAQDEVTQRWMAEVQAYKDSLNKIVCVTGTRFLSSYNDDAFIPVATQTQQ